MSFQLTLLALEPGVEQQQHQQNGLLPAGTGSAAADLKKCFKCGELKLRTEFYRHPQMGDGLLGKCKECNKKDVSANYRARKPQYQKYYRDREKTEHRKKAKQVAQIRRRQNQPEKYKVHYLVHKAIRDKKLIRKPCEVCGNPKSEAHHDDYSKPLDVRWLCFKHHRQHHGQEVT